MKSEIEITGIRVAELTDELSRKTEESRKFKVIQISEGKLCFFVSLNTDQFKRQLESIFIDSK